MPLEVFVKASDGAVKRERNATAQRVIEYLGNQLPEGRLLCFLDDQEWQSFKEENGAANRGFYQPITMPHPFWFSAPLYIAERLVVDRRPAFDDFIYLHGSTCASVMGLTMTLAHELQHFIQRGKQPHLWAANSLVPKLSKTTVKALGLRWCDLPHEREARIVSKRTAEELFGPGLVRQYIDERITEHVTECDAADWECVRDLETSAPYDLASATELFFPTLRDHRAELEQTLKKVRSECPNFLSVDFDALFGNAA